MYVFNESYSESKVFDFFFKNYGETNIKQNLPYFILFSWLSFPCNEKKTFVSCRLRVLNAFQKIRMIYYSTVKAYMIAETFLK